MSSKLEWRLREGQPPYFSSDVEVWLAEMGPVTPPTSALLEKLSASERARAARFTLERDARRFVFRHAILRSLLEFYLHDLPAAVEVEVSESGELSLPAVAPVKIAISQSGAMAIFAMSSRGAIGIHIERVRPLDEGSTLIESLFTFEEQQSIRELPSELQMEGFYTCWSRKEALLKGTGETLSHCVTAEQSLTILDESPRSILVPGRNTTTAWTVVTLPRISGYAAAIAIEGEIPSLSTWIVTQEIVTQDCAVRREQGKTKKSGHPADGSQTISLPPGRGRVN